MKLNLGCGTKILPEFKNYDIAPINNNVFFIDLNKLPLPFNDNSIEVVLMDNSLEHLTIDNYSFMLEIHRILVKGGLFKCYMPFNCPSVLHTSSYHPLNYFDLICGLGKNKIANPHLFNKNKACFVRIKPSKHFPFIYKTSYYVLEKV